jgi:hypothetical protein
MTPFALLLGAAGLSHREASDFLQVRLDTIHAWSSGRNNCRPAVLDELLALIQKQERAAREAIAQIEQTRSHHPAAEIELGYPTDDYEAKGLGWPSVGAWRAMAARVVVAAMPLRLVPRGSSLATAAAIEAHQP